MSETSTYQRELAWQLECRGVPDDVISDALDDVAQHEAHGDDVVREFGRPEDYAATFTRESGKVKDSFWPTLGGVLAVAWMIGAVIALKIWDDSLPTRTRSLVFLPALVLLAGAATVGFVRARSRSRRRWG